MQHRKNRAQKVSEYDQEIPQSHTADQLMAPWGRVTEDLCTVTRHPQDNKSKATSSLFLFNMIAKLERTQRAGTLLYNMCLS